MRIGITAGVNIFHTGGHFWGPLLTASSIFWCLKIYLIES
tara:strand:+ start:25 stop:144 length:120 start_codon:yes stop_codon:yes gene_type:complete